MQADPSPADINLFEGPLQARLSIPSDPMAVREGLRALFGTAMLCSLPLTARGTAEIVLAEALNNIVEHAYADSNGQIDLLLSLQHPDLLCQIEDHGRPMPGDALPSGKLRTFSNFDDLPEGGFGWHLIRTLSRDLKYQRDAGRNCLRFCLDTGQSVG